MAKKIAQQKKLYLIMRPVVDYIRNSDGSLKRDSEGRYQMEFTGTYSPKHGSSGAVAGYSTLNRAKSYSRYSRKNLGGVVIEPKILDIDLEDQLNLLDNTPENRKTYIERKLPGMIESLNDDKMVKRNCIEDLMLQLGEMLTAIEQELKKI
jgi:hypothetical protein